MKKFLSFLGSLMMLVIAGGIGAFVAFSETYSPEKYVEDYYDCFIQQSYAALYKNSDTKNSEFITSNNFVMMMVNDFAVAEEDKDYSLGKLEADGDFMKATVSCKNPEGDGKITWDLKLEESDEVEYKFFHKWKVNLEDFILKNVRIQAKKGVDVVLDGTNLSELDIEGVTKEVDKKTEMVTYTIDRLFMGSHSLVFDYKLTETLDKIVYFDNENKEYVLESAPLKADTKDKMKDKLVQVVSQMYNSAFAGEGIDNVYPLFIQTEIMTNKLTKVYDSLIADINKEDGATLLSLDITEYEVKFEDYKFDLQTDVTLEYVATFSAKGARSLMSGVRENYEGSNKGKIVVTFKRIDAKWVATNLKMKCLDYSKPPEPEEEE